MITNTITIKSSGILDSLETLNNVAKELEDEYQRSRPKWKPLQSNYKKIGVVLVEENRNIQVRPLKMPTKPIGSFDY